MSSGACTWIVSWIAIVVFLYLIAMEFFACLSRVKCHQCGAETDVWACFARRWRMKCLCVGCRLRRHGDADNPRIAERLALFSRCRCPRGKPDPITGQYDDFADHQRKFDGCGPDAVWFEPKEQAP